MTNKNYTNTDSKHWNKMFVYYKWVFMLLFLSFGIVLLFSDMVLAGICMIVLGLYVAPFEVLPLSNEKTRTLIKNIIAAIAAILFVVSFIINVK